ncbi:MAG TPA: phosphoribosylanthranilate isomerase [Candidatus Binataceae bacterium]|nr:phosphoribosylanthranilate isomerase [Candidatus Binataceae bacterium]
MTDTKLEVCERKQLDFCNDFETQDTRNVSVKVKICGITSVEDARAALECGADFIGLNFYEKSPRYVALDRAREISSTIEGAAHVVGVFVNASREYVMERIEAVRLAMVQFHGDESEDFLSRWPAPVIRAIRIPPGEQVRALPASRADFILIDTFHPGLYGGTGESRRISDLRGLDLSRVFLSGGLTCENVAEAAALSPYAVDVASGVESAPGVKDHRKLRRFIENAKSTR